MTSEIKQQSIDDFINHLASGDPTPGGGSVCAVMGSMSAALVSMVANLTIGKKKYLSVEQQMQALLEQAAELNNQLLDLLKADIEAFNQVMQAYRLPKQSDEEKNKRNSEIQSALITATEVPLSCAEISRRLIELSKQAAHLGNINVASDAGVAVLAAQAALRSSALNVYVNTGLISNPEFKNNCEAKIAQLLAGADSETEEIYALVKSKL